MKIFTPVKAIRAKCMDCCCNELKEIRECDILHCALWPYRMGRRPRPDEAARVENHKKPKRKA